MKRIFYFIALLSYVGFSFFLVYFIIDIKPYIFEGGNEDDLIFYTSYFIFILSSLYLTLSSKFWKSGNNVIFKLEKENLILVKKIKNRDLVSELDTFNKKK